MIGKDPEASISWDRSTRKKIYPGDVVVYVDRFSVKYGDLVGIVVSVDSANSTAVVVWSDIGAARHDRNSLVVLDDEVADNITSRFNS